MQASSISMGTQIQMVLLASVLLELLNLYIIQVSSMSFAGVPNYVRLKSIRANDRNHHQLASRTLQVLPALETRLLGSEAPATLQAQQVPSASVALRGNKMDDIFLEATAAADGQDPDDERRQLKQQYNNQIDTYDTINLDDSLESESEILASNHQSVSYSESSAVANSQAKYNPRHYSHQNQHQPSSSVHPHQYHHQQHNHYQQHKNGQQQQLYGKYSPNIFANNYNLNYIHSFLTNKPALLSPPSLYSSQPVVAPPPPSSSSSTPAPHQQPTYTSSILSAAVVSLQQSIAQQQQQQSANSNQLQLASDPTSANNRTSDEPAPPPASRSGPSATMCGRQQVVYREPRVVGGNSTFEGEFPWAVSIQRHGNHHCGGVIVGRRWILTAAHCVRSQLVSNLVVRTGGHTLARSANGVNSHLERDYQVEQIVMHDDFSRYDNLTASQMKSSANTNNADIALLKLRHEIKLNDLAWPVCFPQRDAGNFSGHDAIVIGWGKLNEKSEEFSNELQKVKLTIIDNKVCQNWFRQAGRDMPIDERIICAGFKHGGKDACHGDSGGPLLSRVNGQYAVVGVVSTGIGCARPLLPGLYSRVSSYMSWIERHLTS